jgi:UDP-N-acetylmuramoyl-tripeptide--D-alanyl-D-alanine ligase
MMRDLATLARVTGGMLHGVNASFGRVASDSRSVAGGDLFVALRGERYDAHDFVADVAGRGAAGALVNRLVSVHIAQVVVPEVLAGLTDFSRAWRHDFAGTIVGITGSNGKTTVKEMTGAILAQRGACLVTQGNLNNHIGVPLTLARLAPEHRYGVIEMGANHPGEIAHLASVAAPDVGLVINAGPAHLEGFGGIEGVARAKAELFEALSDNGTAVINADDRFADLWRGLARRAGRRILFGMRAPADFRAEDVATRLADDRFVTEFVLDCPLGRRCIALNLGGEHNVMNALAAAAAAYAAGAGLEDIERGLASMQPVSGRMQLKPALAGARLIDDSYNANPGSVLAGLRSLAAIPGEHWLVLGEMAELGVQSAGLHADIGLVARETGVARLLAVGPETRHAVEAFGPGASWFADVEELVAAVGPALHPGVTVLIKGSRVNRLERVAVALGAAGGAQPGGAH